MRIVKCANAALRKERLRAAVQRFAKFQEAGQSKPTKSFDAGSQFHKLAATKPDANAILPQPRSV